MKVLIPLAGRGTRFKEEGYENPKPLIKLIKEPMIKWATKNIKVPHEDTYFYLLKDQIEEYKLDKELKNIFSDGINIVVIDKVTEGAPLTLLMIRDIINTDEDIVIWNGDQCFDDDFLEILNNTPKEYDGIIPVFESTQTKFSYAKVDENMNVLETAEKVPISNYATIGVYYFRHGKDFVWAVDEMIRKDIRRGNEFFVCPSYNELIGKGMKIKAVKVDNWSLGTPEDVEHFKKYYRGSI